MRTWLAGLGAWLLTIGTLMSAPLFDEAVPTLTLKDGTVLQDAQIKGYLTKVVMVRHRDGIRTVPYGLFPDQYQEVLASRRPAPRDAPIPAPAGPVSTAGANATPVNQRADLRFGCSFSVLAVTGDIIMMEIRNQSAEVARVIPEMFVARTSSGGMLHGAQWVGLDSEGRVSTVLMRQQLIAPGDVVTLRLMLAPIPHEDAIETVQWKK